MPNRTIVKKNNSYYLLEKNDCLFTYIEFAARGKKEG
jgi:hypothetical protein